MAKAKTVAVVTNIKPETKETKPVTDAPETTTVAEETKPKTDDTVTVVAESSEPKVKLVEGICLESGWYRVGPEYYTLNKGKRIRLPENVYKYFRKLNKVERGD